MTLILHLYDRPLQAWTAGYSTASVARFIRHHVHQIRADHEPLLADDPDITFSGLTLMEIQFGQYLFYAGRDAHTLNIMPTLISVDGVQILATPDRSKLSVPADVVLRFYDVLHAAPNRRVAVFNYQWTRAAMFGTEFGQPMPKGPFPPLERYSQTWRFDYKIFVTGTDPRPHHNGTGWKCIGVLDLETGVILPEYVDLP